MANHFATWVMAGLLTTGGSGAFAADAGALSQQPADQWRVSKLAGVAIYGPANETVGRISDVLMSKDGKAGYVIVGVGGFLGIGEKDVAVPFDQVKFTNQPLTPPMNPASPSNNLAAPAANNAMAAVPAAGAPNASGGLAPNGGVAPGTTVGLGTPSTMPGTTAAPAMAGTTDMAQGSAASATTTAYPDHGTIDMTADQLKSAPAFHFAK